mgnify:CR=1 FL=1
MSALDIDELARLLCDAELSMPSNGAIDLYHEAIWFKSLNRLIAADHAFNKLRGPLGSWHSQRPLGIPEMQV